MSVQTPTPWHADDAECVGTGMAYVYGSDGSDFAHVPAADAAYIVRCANHHDDLVAALRALVEYYDGWDELASRVQEMDVARAVLAKLEAS